MPPEDENEETNESSANERSIQRMRARMNGNRQPIDDDDDPEELETDPDEEPEAEPDLRPGEIEAESRQSRKERRRNRYSEMREELAEERRRRRELEEAAHQSALSRLRGEQQQSQGDPILNDLETRLDQNYDAVKALTTEYNGVTAQRRLTPEEETQYERRARALKRDGDVIAAAIAQHRMRPSPEAEEEARSREVLRAEFPEVYASAQQRKWAEGEYIKLTSEGAPKGLATARKALAAAKNRFSNRRRAPAPEYKERFTAEPRGVGGGLVRQEGGRTYVDMGGPNSPQRQMAHQRYPYLSEEEAEKRWAADRARKKR